MSVLLGRIDKEAISSGIFPDMGQQSAPLWEAGENIYFHGGKASPFPGQSQLFSIGVTDRITGVKALGSEVLSDKGVCAGTDSALYLWSNLTGVASAGSGYTGRVDQTPSLLPSRWSIEQWGAWVIATNGKNTPAVYKGSSFGNLGGINFTTAEIILRWKTFLFAFNLNTGRTRFAWSDDDDPETWIATATNRAGASLARDCDDQIMAALLLGSVPVFYGPNTMHAINYTGDNDVFGHQKLLTGIGALGKNAVASVSRQHYGISQKGLWRTDGNSFEYFDNPAVRAYIRTNLNREQAAKTLCYYDQTINHVVYVFPSGNSTENNSGLAYNVEEGQFVPVSLAQPVGVSGDNFEASIFGSHAGIVYESDPNAPFSPTVGNTLRISAEAVTYDLDVGYGSGGYGMSGYSGQSGAG